MKDTMAAKNTNSQLSRLAFLNWALRKLILNKSCLLDIKGRNVTC